MVPCSSGDTDGSTSFSDHETAFFDPGSMNLSVHPGDDFFNYVNGDWIKSHPVPGDKSKYSEFEVVRDRNYDIIRAIVESAANNTTAPEGSLDQKIGEFYRVGMDNATIEKQRLEPIEDYLRMIDSISSLTDLQNVSTIMLDHRINPFFLLYAEPDKNNSKIMIATLSQGGLGLPDRDFYFRMDNESAKTREEYVSHVAKTFVLLGYTPEVANNSAKIVMRIETKLANSSFTNVDDTDEVKTYNRMSIKELQALAPAINWSHLFSSLGRPDITEVNVRNPSYFVGLSCELQNESIGDWKIVLRWKLVGATSSFLSSDLVNEGFDFYSRKLNGQQEIKPRWKRVLDAENILGEAIGRIYIDKYFDSDSKERMQQMVANLKKAFRYRIENLTWMGPETKQKALKKLDVLDVQVGYPDEWLNYSDLQVKNDSYAMNILRACRFWFHQGPDGIDRAGKPVDNKLWEMHPQETNAYADDSRVLIVFPAGILQPPFFNKDADDAVNYGAIGAIIGHEMTHNFDGQGRKFDASGNLTDWWTPKDAESFNNSTNVLVDEYNGFEVLPGVYVNGNLTLQENIADLGGLTMAYHAYELSRKAPAEKIDGFTDDQRLFLSYAQIYRESDTNESLRTQALTDTHSPAKFRVNGVVFNVPEFYIAFPSVRPEDKLYRPESERPAIW